MGIYMGMSLNTDTLNITREILSLIAELDEFKGAWRALGTLAPERLSALRHVATIESIGSSTLSFICGLNNTAFTQNPAYPAYPPPPSYHLFNVSIQSVTL
jgi:hypothetical protein